MQTIEFKRLHRDAKIPSRAHVTDAGMDVYAINPVILNPGVTIVPLGFGVGIPHGWTMLIVPRSGLASDGITIANSPGVIDSGYRGEVKALLLNTLDEPYFIEKGDRIGQVLFMPVADIDFIEVENLTATDRGVKGIGGTGR